MAHEATRRQLRDAETAMLALKVRIAKADIAEEGACNRVRDIQSALAAERSTVAVMAEDAAAIRAAMDHERHLAFTR